ncbi:hypothetical protein MCOR25_009623 [Pyricularia grisea]|uniref:Uncharacterized protein n=1 Tax=Pyricularia grisea TaxID=148305 RepID=A0A6P8BLL8_PYRGI|nr:uncharacterized protein PgNI_02442 [Pyricularia grisea]KAI6351989.1 hypothetical protein MCOR25_009623 [Pyricularia grisea]TLD17713.1 hypothetical protein PgNI_02442 [Pyricularia grisea]
MAQTAPQSLPDLLGSLTQSLNTAFEVTPKLAGIEPTALGISLLDLKNELLLSYLQNLVFLILLKTRSAKKSNGLESAKELNDAVVKKLVELRLYLEKGVRPLEDKLRYQIEKLMRAIDDAERQEKAAEEAGMSKKKAVSSADSDSESGSGDDGESSDDDEDLEEGGVSTSADLSNARPNLKSIAALNGEDENTSRGKINKDGIYRPPKIAPTVMPTLVERRERTDRSQRPLKSATMDEFINDELSTAPVAQPSIGTNIAGRGRHVKTAAERRDEAERQAYEETHFVRLPKESKKDRAKAASQGAGRMNFGGEEWRGLGEGVDRINRLVKTKDNGGGSRTRALLEKSRKRSLGETTDGPRGSGVAGAEERYQKRAKMQELGRTSRGKGR